MRVRNDTVILAFTLAYIALIAQVARSQQTPSLDGLTQELEKSIQSEKKSDQSEMGSDVMQSLEKLKAIQSMMNEAAASLRNGVTGDETQRQQKQAIAIMDELLKRLQDQRTQSQSSQADATDNRERTPSPSGQQNLEATQANQGERENDSMKEGGSENQNGSSDGGSRSSANGGNTPSSVSGAGRDVPVVQGPPVERLSQGVWGHLPDRVRRELQAVSPEQYLPAYRAKIEAYYRRLAEQNAK